MNLIDQVIPLFLLMIFGAGIFWAGKYTKSGIAQFFLGLLLGFGIILVLVGVAFAGCCLLVSPGSFR